MKHNLIQNIYPPMEYSKGVCAFFAHTTQLFPKWKELPKTFEWLFPKWKRPLAKESK